jgi:CarD family transcriptional regulator
VEHIELVEGFERYYVIDIPSGRLTVRVPVGKVSDLGLRPVMSQANHDRVLRILRSRPRRLPDEYKERQLKVEENIKTGRSVALARVVRDLTGRERKSYLTKRDGDLLAQARDLLADEMAMATGDEMSACQEIIDSALGRPEPN